MQRLYGLQVDFLNQHGHFMVLSAPEGLKREGLSSFQIQMLSANKIPKLLELQVEEKDGETLLFYNITGKRMLTHRLRTEKLTLQRFYSLLLEIADVLDDSKIYMLQAGRYILKEDFIFCGNGLEDLHFTYVPKEQLDSKASVAADLQQLASAWIHRVEELQGKGFQELMSYLQEENFNLPELKQLLLKHLRLLVDENPPAAGKRPGPAAPAFSKPAVPAANQAAASAELRASEVPGKKPESMWTPEPPPSFPQTAASLSEGDLQFVDVEPERDKPKRNKLVIGLTVLVGCGFLWKWYLDEPGPVTLALCAGLTAVLAAAAVLLLRKPGKLKDRHDPADKETDDWLAGFANPGKDAFRTSAEPAAAASGADFLSGLGLEAGQQRAQPEPYEPAAYTSPKETRPPNAEMKTTLLRPADATVFLGSAGKHVQSAVPALEYAKDGSRERVPITKSRFIIGRSESEADLVREETGISRIHAEIVKEAEGYSVRDLGSRNGTYVNGVLLAPYRMQLLQEGDIVKIITTEYTFKMGS